MIKKGVYTELDTNQEMHLHLEMRNTGRENQQVPTLTQAERKKTDVSVRNTLSQLHWLHHSVNTLYRRALIANTWLVWIYKNQTKTLRRPPSHMLGFVHTHCMTMPCLKFPSVNSLTPGYKMTSKASQATVPANLLKQHVSSSAAGWGTSGYRHLIRAPGHNRPLHSGELPRLNQVNHSWPQVKDGPAYCHANYCHSKARPTTGPTDLYQSKPSIHLDRWEVRAPGSQSVQGRCLDKSGWW